MKKFMLFALTIAFSAVLFTACEKEDPITVADDELGIEVLHNVVAEKFTADDLVDIDLTGEVTEVDGASERLPLGPDLVVAGVASTLPNNGPCAVQVGQQPLPNGTCNGGTTPNSFTLLARIRNIGNANIPPGSFRVSWAISGSPLQGITVVNHTGIPAGSSIGVSRGWTLGCPTGTPIGLQRRNFFVTADVTNVVAERNEMNNVSRPYTICDDI